MIALEYEMTYTETIEGPLGPTAGSPVGERLCRQSQPRRSGVRASSPPRRCRELTGSGRTDGIRRPDLRAQLITDDGELILFRYDVAMIRSSARFLEALASGEATDFDSQYMRIAPQFEVGAGRYSWLAESLFLSRGRLTGPRAIAYELYRVI
jgi:Protein of unknown function (DUF3237)